MSKRSDRKDEALKARFTEHQEAQRERLLQMVNNLPRGALGGADNDPQSLSDQVTQWQIASGQREPEDREGLSIGQKNLLYRAGMETMSQGKFPEGTQFDASGMAWQQGALPGTWVPARPDIPDVHDFEREEKDQREFAKAAERIWPQYRTIFGDDSPEDVEAAVAALVRQSGMSARDLNAIADDSRAKRAAFDHIHNLAEEIAFQREYGSYDTDAYDGDDNRTAGFGGGGTASGATGRSYQEHEAGSLSADLAAWQKKRGLSHE